MAIDTKYRPRRFEGVIGQDNTVKVLRQFVLSGAGFHQSYLFCGGRGSGKTTLGRILARALLCEDAKGGDPCDKCDSCRSILERGSHECFVEVDAANNSGKEDVTALTDLLQFDTLSGRRRIYLFDESHRLSKEAVDALLKPMEDTARNSEDKLLVCIFCTTEPEKMKTTIFSRCAPAFVIQHVTPEGLADHLARICDSEGIKYDREALILIAEVAECHIRDALKSVEGVSMLGRVDVENVRSYLRLNAVKHYMKVLLLLGRDLAGVITTVEELSKIVSPVTVYERLAELSMVAYRAHIGAGKAPSYWPANVVAALGNLHGPTLVRFAHVFSSKPAHPTFAMVECDLAQLHWLRIAGVSTGNPAWTSPIVIAAAAPAMPAPPLAEIPVVPTQAPANAGRVTAPESATPSARHVAAPPRMMEDGTYVDSRGVNQARTNPSAESHRDPNSLAPLSPDAFRDGLQRLFAELQVDGRGRPT